VLRPTPPIATARLLLRPLAPTDLDPFCDIYLRPEVTRYLYWKPRSRAEVAEWLAQRSNRGTIEREGEVLSLALTLPQSGAVIGNVVLKWLSAAHQQGEVGFVVHPGHHRRGYAGEAARVMLRLGFEGLGLHRVIGRCDGRNTASATVMRRLGMRHEAHLRENEYIDGEWTDECIFAMLRSEWAALDRPAANLS
jgi:RimJ/RimL family protein N-acetyltransferase